MKDDIDKINEQIESIQNSGVENNDSPKEEKNDLDISTTDTKKIDKIEDLKEDTMEEVSESTKKMEPVEENPSPEVSLDSQLTSVEEKPVEEQKEVIPEERTENPFEKEEKKSFKESFQLWIEKFKSNKNYKLYLGIGIGVIVLLLFVIIGFILFSKSFSNSKAESFQIVSVEKVTKGVYATTDETFVIRTKKGSLEEVRKHIYVEPAISYRIEQKGINEYRLVTSDIPSDTLININYIEDFVAEDKWAFQSTKDLKVSSFYPTDGSKGVSVNTAIEVTFSYYDLENVDQYFEISPAVEGTFSHNGRTWTFKPSQPLTDNTVYTVRIKEGLSYGGEKLGESAQASFTTNQATSTSGTYQSLGYDSITVDNIETFRPVDYPMFRSRYSSNNKDKSITRVEVLKLKNSDEFKKMIEKQDYAADSLGDVAFHIVDEDNSSGYSLLYSFDNPLEKGYYSVKVYAEDGELAFTIPMQINELSAYLVSTQNDMLVWVGSDNTLLKDIPVTYEKKTVHTDKDGVALFEDYNTLEKKVKYVTVGKDNPIFIGVNTDDNETYSNGYVYVDRPLYKSTDDVRIWGYIPFKFYREWKDFSKEKFVLSFNNETIPIKVNDDGTFMTTYHLDNYKDGYYYFDLKYKNKSIARRSVEVLQYEKENYTFKVQSDREYAYVGDNYHFTVEVKHISGVLVPNKEIRAVYNNNEYTAITDTNGVASFDIPITVRGNFSQNYSMDYVKITTSLSEYAQKGFYTNFYAIDRLAYGDTFNYTQSKNEVEATIKEYPVSYDYKSLSDLASNSKLYSGTVQIGLTESVTKKVQTGTKYNEFTKKNEPIYTYNNSSQDVYTGSVEIKDGKAKFTIPYEYKKGDKETSYSYYVKMYLVDSKGNTYEFSRYISPYPNSGNSLYRNGYLDFGYGGASCMGSGGSYYLYTYYFSNEGGKYNYSVGENIPRNMYKYTGEKEEYGGKVLFVKHKNSILQDKVVTYKEGFTIPFEDEDRPNIRMTSAYFKDGVFYRMPMDTISQNKKDNELTVKIKPESNHYEPGDKVKVTINVGKNGKGIKSRINVSVVDEGVFNAANDYTGILNGIYTTKYYFQYTYSTYRDYTFYNDGGGCGGTSGGARENFGDTVFFDTFETDKNGNVTVEFKLNDSITSFRITVHAVTDDADVGVGQTLISSSLPVSISFTEPRGLKVSDEVVLNAFGLGSTKENIHYEFTIEGTDKKVEKDALVGQTVYASFGQLPAGEYKAVITATSSGYTDKVRYPIQVVNSQTEVFVRNTFSIKDQAKIKPVKNPIILELYRDSFKDYETFLNIIADTKEDRFDTRLSYTKALFYENRYLEEKNVVDIGDVSSFKGDTGWKFLNAEEVSYPLTAIASYYDKDLRLDKNIYYNMTKSDKLEARLNGYVVLAALKEPILDDVRYLFKNFSTYDEDSKEKLILTALFLGDYKTVRNYYSLLPDNQGLKTYLSTFVYKNKANQMIKDLYANDIANRYLYFSIVSYFENNHVDLDTKEDVTVSYGKENQTVSLLPLGKKKLTIYQKDLKDLKIQSKYDDIYYNYYYEGSFDEIDASLKDQVITMSFSNENPKLGDTVDLNIDLSRVPKNVSLKLYLPNGLRLSNTKNLFVVNRIDYLYIYIGSNTPDNISIPLYASSYGSYTIEPIIMKTEDDRYLMSNSLKINIQE